MVNLTGHASTQRAPSDDRSYTKIDPGPYVAIVKDNVDLDKMGRLRVVIPSLAGFATVNDNELITVEYLAPFYGAKSPLAVKDSGVASFDASQHSYGMWMVPPDIDTRVLVIFAEGEIKQGFWMGCIQEPFVNHMVPGIASSTDTFSPESNYDDVTSKQTIYGTDNVPAGEINRSLFANTGQDIDRLKKPIHPFAETLRQQGLIQDNVRGNTSSSARRESPSQVFGISTPGRVKQGTIKSKLGPKDKSVDTLTVRDTGHTFVLDDGDVAGDNQLIRLRSASGHQILL